MPKVDQDKINNAVQRCLARCYASTDVLATLAAFLQELRLQQGWAERDVHEVELAVVKVLNRIVENSDEPPDAGEIPQTGAHRFGRNASDVSDA